MQKNRLAEIFKDYEPNIQHLLKEVLQIEQQYITANLNTNSGALKEIREKVDEIIEESCKQ